MLLQTHSVAQLEAARNGNELLSLFQANLSALLLCSSSQVHHVAVSSPFSKKKLTMLFFNPRNFFVYPRNEMCLYAHGSDPVIQSSD
jgi:hypothetical protein